MNKSYFLFIFIFAIKSTFLLALLTGDRWTVLLLRVGAALALVAYEGCNDVAVFACRRLSICFHVELAFLADCAGAALTVIDYIPKIFNNTN